MSGANSLNRPNVEASPEKDPTMALDRSPTVRLGAGAGFAGDRIDPALDLAERGQLDYLVFECLGERTIAAAHARRLSRPGSGYDPRLLARMRAVLPACRAAGTRVITNSGAAEPLEAGRAVTALARELGLTGLKVAVLTGDDVLGAVRNARPVDAESGELLDLNAAVSANAYLGAEGIADALGEGADVVITGRVSDPALYLGPLMHEHGWTSEDVELLGRGTLVGHLLECAGQLTGGYFADPGPKPVPGLDRLGFPFADVDARGEALFQKLPDTGGLLTPQTCAEQLLYEVDDPGAYLTPDVVADFSRVSFTTAGPDAVRATGATGRSRPAQLKVTLGYRGGWLGEGQISYAGPRALERARLAGEVTRSRLQRVHGLAEEAVELEYIGTGAAFRGLGDGLEALHEAPPEVRLRVSARVDEEQQAAAVPWEVESLYTNGPAGGGGARGSVTEQVSIRSCLLDRHLAPYTTTMLEA
ncbi:acyclic terpene utilization AtuA family protein [Citricoccus nitrophenolicus]